MTAVYTAEKNGSTRTESNQTAVGRDTMSHAALRRLLLTAGIIGAILYPLGDIVAAMRYPGFSYRDQAVSELFAIGAPTARLVVSIFTLSTTLVLLFGIGIRMSAHGNRRLQWAGVMLALGMVDALVLWNFFPMHMRGVTPTMTDLVHGLLAIDPFLLAAQVLVAIAFHDRMRTYTVATIAFATALALTSFWYVPAVIANQPTPWMGIAERTGQYATNLWYAVLAVVLLRQARQTMP